MKDYFNLRKSKLLLFTLLAALVGGVSPAWAQITEEFTTENWPEGWALSTDATESDYYIEYDSSNDYYYPSGRRGVYGQVSSGTTKYIITPVVNGSGSFKFKRINSSNGSVYVYTYDNGVLSSSPIASNTSKPTSFTTVSFSGVDNMRLAIVLNGRMDDFTYILGAEASCKTPKNLVASDVTDESATITWDAGEADTWNLKYKGANDADFTEVTNLSTNSYELTSLDAATTYTVQVQTVCSANDQSAWASVEFSTPLCAISAQKTITCTIWDTYGDGWNSAALQIVDAATGIEIAQFAPTNSDGKNQVEKTVGLCPNRNYNINWISGNYNSECRFTVKDVDGIIIDGLDYSSSYPSSSTTLATYSWSDTPVEGAKFAIDLNTFDFGIKNVNEVAGQMFTITNSGNAALPVTFTDATDFYVAKTVKFTKPTSWNGEKLYIYAWDSSENNLTASWPGDEVTVAAQNEYSQWVYTATLPKGATGVIFNDGTNQTSNISTADFKDIVGIHLDGTTPTINENVDFSVPAGGSASFYVRMVTTTAGVKSGNITLSYSAVNGTETIIPVSGTVMPAGAEVVDFNTAIPSRWDNESNGWSIDNGAAKCTGKKNLTTQKLDFSADDAPFFIMKVKASDSGSGDYVTVEGSSDNGATWNAFDKKTYSYPTDFGANTGDYSSIVVSIPNTVNKLRFNGYYVLIDEIAGLKYSDNDPVMGVYTDAECTAANKIATTSVTAGFDFVTADPTPITYYIKNDGTGTMMLSKTDVAGLTVTFDKTSVAAGEKATLTIEMPVANNGGYHGGNVVVTAEDLGTFTVAASGVVVEGGKLNLNFASDAIPSTWTASNWSKDTECITTGYSSSATLTTSALTAVDAEQLVVVAKNTYTGSSYTVGVKYKKAGTEDEFVDLIPAANAGTSYTMLVGTIDEAGEYLLQFNGGYAQIQRIYGLSKPNAPEMVVYDGTTAAGATFSFGKVTDENDTTHEFTVKNEGLAKLTGLAAALSGDDADHYTVAIAGATGDNNDEIEAGAEATITVTQLKDNLGTHSATLTISATGLDSKEITLSGNTVDHTVLDVDFDTSSAWPTEILEHDGWSTYYSTYTNDGYASNTSSTFASLILTPLTVANTTDKLTFQAKYYSSSARDLIVRYTTDGGITWNEYECSEEDPKTSFKSQIGYSFSNLEVANIPTGTVAFDFYGKSIYLDNIAGDMKVTSAPLVSFTTVSDNISDANLKADGTATYTLANKGNADYVATVTLSNVTASVEGEDVAFSENTLTIPAGKTAVITVTMAFAAPYGEKTGSMSITSESWVGDINESYTATLVDPTDFVEDFAGNARPAGWYSEGWSYTDGVASVNAGVEKPMITELIGAEEGKNTLTFNAWSTSENQTLNIYTSTDRKNWTRLGETITLTNEETTVYTRTLTNNDQYIKFGAAIAKVDNINGVKKLDAPAHDLYEVSTTMAATGTPGASYTATVVGVSLRADETDIMAELWFKKGEGDGASYNNIATLTNQEMIVNTNKTFTLTGNLPTVEGDDYTAWVTVKKASDGSVYFNTDVIKFTLAHTTLLTISTFENVPAAQADDNNEFNATFNVTVQNTGSKPLAANEISVTLTDNANAGNVFTNTLATTLFLETSNGTVDISKDNDNNDAKLGVWMWNPGAGEWAELTKIRDGFYSVDLKGNTYYKVVRQQAGMDFDFTTCWNETGEISFADGNLRTFNNWGSGKDMILNPGTFSLTNGQTVPVQVTVSGTLTDGEDANFSYKVKENVSNSNYSGVTRSVSVTAAPVIELDETVGNVASTGQHRKVSLKHSFVEGWNTICLPFAINATDIHAEAKALAFTAYNSSSKELTFSPVTELEANMPYVIYVPAAITTPFSFSGKTVTTSDDPKTVRDEVTFQGTYAPVTFSEIDGDQYGFTAAGKIAKASASATMKGFRAYFNGIPEGATARFLGDDSQGISTISMDNAAPEGTYNLQGQKVEKLYKGGLYIINGKKQIVK